LPPTNRPLDPPPLLPMQIIAARRYISPRTRPLSREEAETRRLAFSIKSTASPTADFALAALEMARLITGPCWLVPVPDSQGNTDANARLCSLIASFCPAAQVAKAITRTQPIQSQCERHRHALGPINPAAHHIRRTGKLLSLRQTYIVDNVTTSGHTLYAAHDALGFGTGLVFADAANHRTQLQTTLF
jgi:hypothetical protein